MFDEQFIKSLEKNLSNRPLRPLEFPGDCVRAAVMAIIRRGAGGTELFFIKRAASPLDRFSGHIAFPGGMKEESDPDMLATAVRETFEETGLNLERCGRVAGRLDDEMPRPAARRGERSYFVTPFVCALVSDASARACDEVERIFWMPVSDLRRLDGADSPEFVCQGRRIWGMTARILEKLLEVLPP